MDGMWWLRGESSLCSGFWLGQLGRVWGQRAPGEGAARKEGATSRCWVRDRVSFVDVDLEVAFKSSKRGPCRFVSALLLENSLSCLDRVSSWGSLCGHPLSCLHMPPGVLHSGPSTQWDRLHSWCDHVGRRSSPSRPRVRLPGLADFFTGVSLQSILLPTPALHRSPLGHDLSPPDLTSPLLQ